MTYPRALALAVALSLTAGGAREAAAQTCTAPAWSAAKPVTTSVYGPAVTQAGGFIYSAGGFNVGLAAPVGQFSRYSPSLDTWTALAPLPTPVYMASLVYDAAGGRLFLFGGQSALGVGTTVQVYTIASNTWAVGPPVPAPRAFMAASAIGGLIYLVGGYSTTSVNPSESQTWAFNPSLGTYTTLAPLPAGLGGAGSAAFGGRLYVMGGRGSDGSARTTNYVYDPPSNAWATAAALPSALNVPAAVSLSGPAGCLGSILLVGGGTPFRAADGEAPTATGATWIYNAVSNTWTAGPTLAGARSFAGAALAGATVLAVAGYNGSTSVATAERLRFPACSLRTQAAWAARAGFPATGLVRAWGTFFGANGKFYALGGRSADGAGNDLLHPAEYDPATDAWQTKAATFADTQVNNMVGGVLYFDTTPYIVVVGGSAAGATTATSAVRRYDPVADTLITLSTDPWPGNAPGNVLPGGAAVFDNKLYVFGGFQINVGMLSTVWVFDPAAAAGSRWTTLSATLPTALGYIPAATSGRYIYLFGGATYSGTLADTTSSLRYDPATDTIAPVATIPRATSQTRAITQLDDAVWVLSGGWDTTSDQVDVYQPLGDNWTTARPFPTARRNFAADLDPATGRVWAVGGYVASAPAVANEQLGCVPKGDIDRDGYPDLVFRNNAAGAQNKVWIMNGVARASEAAITPDAASADWKIRGVDDFSLDGANDLVFWNQVSGNVEFWLMNGTARVGAPLPLSGGTVLPTNWDLAATADFNHDRLPDILWRNVTSQKIVIWTMVGTVKLGNVIPTPDQAVDANWQVVAALDYNNDGNTDLLWYNATSGKIVTWYMDTSVARTAGQFTSPPNAGDNNWRVLASSDYSRGNVPATPPLGSPDIVWRNATSGNQVIWHMDFNSTRRTGQFTSPAANTPALDWTIVGPR